MAVDYENRALTLACSVLLERNVHTSAKLRTKNNMHVTTSVD